MATVICPNKICQAANEDSSLYCASCGGKLSAIRQGTTFKAMVGEFDVKKQLREDVVSTSFLVQDLSTGSIYILREYLPQRADDKFAKRAFHQKARDLEKSGSERIVRPQKYFTQDHRFYTIEEPVQGAPLADELNRAFTEEEAYSVLNELVDVLTELHGANPRIVHGDITPFTILRRDSDHKLLLTDFGVLKDATQVVQSNGDQTLSTAHIPAYAPPERREGKLCPASDVYTLGATLLGLLSGKPLHELYDSATHQWAWQEVKASESTQLLLRMMLAPSLTERLHAASHIRSALQRITNGQRYFDLGQHGDAISEWKKAYDLVKNPALKAKIEQVEKLATVRCPKCGAEIEPGQGLCRTCELKRNKDRIRPLVEAAVGADKLLSQEEKALILQKAGQEGIENQAAEVLIRELLFELGAREEAEKPRLEVRPPSLKFEGLKKGSQYQQNLEIHNVGRGELRGRIISDAAWLKVSPATLDPKAKKQVITVRVETNTLSSDFKGTGTIRLETNGGNVSIEVHVQMEQVSPAVSSVQICSRCYVSNTATDKYCAKCGWDLSKTWTSPPPANVCPKCKTENPSENKYCSKCSWELARPFEEEREKPKKAKYVIAGMVVATVALVVIWQHLFSPEAQLNQKIENRQLVTPVGTSAYDKWLEWRKTNPSSSSLAKISAKVLPLLRNRGDEVFRRWHDESRATDEEWYEVSRVYEWASQLDPNDNQLRARQSYSNGQIAFRQKRFDDALNEYLQALRYEQCMSLAYNGIGRIYLNKRDYANAEYYYKQAAQCEPQWCYPYVNLGGLYSITKQFEKAEASYKEAIQAIGCAPHKKPSFHYQLALLYDNWGRYCDAKNEYQQALNLAYNDPDPGFNIEQVQRRVDQLRRRCD